MNAGPVKGQVFRFLEPGIDPASGRVHLPYELDGQRLTETLILPPVDGSALDPAHPGVRGALNLLHWVAGVSYWKVSCPPVIQFTGPAPDSWQARWLEKLYRQGLAEFAWRNRLSSDIFPAFPDGPADQTGTEVDSVALPERVLVPLGGGKDSLVALERVRALGTPVSTVALGQSRLIARVAESTGLTHYSIRRTLDPSLARLNRQGAWNGHVPVTAINAAALVLFALLRGFSRVVFANEKSADEPTLTDAAGQGINHQFSKSFEFEQMLSDWLERYVPADLKVFSLLRQERELAICRSFAGLTRYHQVFSSCNRNFHIDGSEVEGRWCGQCPKCHFVFLGLANFMAPQALVRIFGRNLLDDPDLTGGFGNLLALDGHKPFECVGEAIESRAAMLRLASSPQWASSAVVRKLAPLLETVVVPEWDSLLAAEGPHRVPAGFQT